MNRNQSSPALLILLIGLGCLAVIQLLDLGGCGGRSEPAHITAKSPRTADAALDRLTSWRGGPRARTEKVMPVLESLQMDRPPESALPCESGFGSEEEVNG